MEMLSDKIKNVIDYVLCHISKIPKGYIGGVYFNNDDANILYKKLHSIEKEIIKLEKEGLPKKYEFKPFDKVVVRHGNKYYWGIDIFSNYGDEYHDKYQCLTDAYEQCLPYNENTAYLLGTTDDWEGGEA